MDTFIFVLVCVAVAHIAMWGASRMVPIVVKALRYTRRRIGIRKINWALISKAVGVSKSR